MALRLSTLQSFEKQKTMRPRPAKIKVFSDAEVLEAIDLILKMEPDACKALEDHELGKNFLDQSRYGIYYDLT